MDENKLTSNIISITGNGLEVKSFVEIRDTIIAYYKDAYGSDIDTSSTTADGIFINNLALMMNNIAQTVNTIYQNLNVASASGKFLDVLCSLSNVTRKPDSKSVAHLTITNNGSTSTVVTRLIDSSNNTWVLDSDLTIDGGETISSVRAECESYGPVQLLSGSVLYGVDVNVTGICDSDAIVGQWAESDEKLRSRRSQKNGPSGLTVLESMISDLLDLPYVEDAAAMQGENSSGTVLGDGTTIAHHNVYISIRYRDGVDYASYQDEIGQMIADKMTPGILTQQTAVVAAQQSYDYVPSFKGISSPSRTTVHWKAANSSTSASNFNIAVTINPFSTYTVDEADIIKNAIVNYVNNLPINNKINTGELISEIVFADPTKNGRATYNVSSVTLTNDLANNSMTFYKITADNITLTVTGG